MENICMICDRKQVEGIELNQHFICENCEQEMVFTQVEDARYHYFLFRLRRLWTDAV